MSLLIATEIPVIKTAANYESSAHLLPESRSTIWNWVSSQPVLIFLYCKGSDEIKFICSLWTVVKQVFLQ